MSWFPYLTLQPEKKNPSLTPMDWVKFLASAVVGLVSIEYPWNFTDPKYSRLSSTLFMCNNHVSFLSQATLGGSLEMPQADLWVIFAILSGVIGYCAKIYFGLSFFFLTMVSCIYNSTFSAQSVWSTFCWSAFKVSFVHWCLFNWF